MIDFIVIVPDAGTLLRAELRNDIASILCILSIDVKDKWVRVRRMLARGSPFPLTTVVDPTRLPRCARNDSLSETGYACAHGLWWRGSLDRGFFGAILSPIRQATWQAVATGTRIDDPDTFQGIV